MSLSISITNFINLFHSVSLSGNNPFIIIVLHATCLLGVHNMYMYLEYTYIILLFLSFGLFQKLGRLFFLDFNITL